MEFYKFNSGDYTILCIIEVINDLICFFQIMTKIVVTQDLGLSDKDIERIKSLGDLILYDNFANSHEDWLGRCLDADVICSGKFGLKQKWQELSDVFISLPFVGVGWVDIDIAKNKNIIFAKSPGCNKEAVSEWIIGMMINLLRDLPKKINAIEVSSEPTQSLAGKKICIVGAGNIGKMVGKVCEALHMDVSFYERDDDLFSKVKDIDIIVDAIASNEETKGMYNKNFFNSLKKGSYFITVTSQKLWDIEAMLDSLDKGILAGVANDCGSIQVDNTKDPVYERLVAHPKVLVTPHTAYNTERRDKMCNCMMIDNIESWLQGNPINIVS